MNIKPKYVLYDICRMKPFNLIEYTHVNDVNTQVLEVSVINNGEQIELSSDYTYTAAIVNRETKALISNSIECSLNGSGNVEISVDNFHQLGAQDLLIELTITDSNENQVLVTPFPLWIHVNASILDDAQVTPDSLGTIPELLEEAKEALEDISNIVTAAAVNQNGTITITLSDGTTVTSTGAVIESTSNKVTTIDANSTNAEYPSAKAVYDAIQNISPPKTDISSATVTLSASSFTYDGTSKAPSVTSVTLNGRLLSLGTDYVVVANPATNAGQYVVAVNGIGDYIGTATTEWTITKAQATITGDDSITISGLGEPVSKTYTTNGDGAFSFEITGNVATVTNTGDTVTITPTSYGTADLTVTVSEGQNYFGTTKTVSVTVEEVQTATVFGVMWDYSLSSPQLARLTSQTDPLGVVTNVPSQEPTACVGNDGSRQSDFDNYMPWSGMVRKNYVNGQIVDFTGYDNGETYVYIPEFWSKIVDDTANNRMYFYISSGALTGFTKHLGSDRYIGRYNCDANFESKPNGTPKVNTLFSDFRTGIKAISNNHFQYDVHCYNAILMLYIVEFANLDSQSMVGMGVVSNELSAAKAMGGTDVLIYHTGIVSSYAADKLAVQYRWIENLWGNIWCWIDGVISQDGLVYLCNDATKYTDNISSDYISTGCTIPATSDWYETSQDCGNCYLLPKTSGGSASTYTCDHYYYTSGLSGFYTGGRFGLSAKAGLFCISGTHLDNAYTNIGSRPILITNGGAS